MRIIHVSDTHSTFPNLPEGDLVVLSGDGLPNASRGVKEIEIPFQTRWVKNNIENYKKWIGDTKFLIISGNHCYINYAPLLLEAGIDAVNIEYKHYEFQGLTFYGFPDIPYIDGEWDLECTPTEMSQQVRRLKDALTHTYTDVLVCHCPPYGILDNFQKNRAGNNQMTDMFAYGLEEEYFPKYVLCGHIHQKASSIKREFGINFINSGTQVTIIDI